MAVPGRRWGSRWSRLNAPLWAAGLTTVLMTAVYAGHQNRVWTVPGLADLELSSVDARFRLRGHRALKDDRIAIVGVDDQTRRALSDQFYARQMWTSLITALTEYQPQAIGLDVLFSSPEQTLPGEVVEQVKQAQAALDQAPQRSPAGDQALAALDAVVATTQGDARLAQAVADSGRVVLGALLHLPKSGESPAQAGTREPAGLARARFGEWISRAGPAARRPRQARYASGSLASIAQGARAAGLLNVIPDPDGAVRQVPGALAYGGRFYMPLGLVMATEVLGTDTSYVAGENRLRVGVRTLPVTRRGDFLLDYLGPGGSFPTVSAIDVINRSAERDALAGKLVLIGMTDALRDKVATPFAKRLDGVEVHATLLHNILHDELMRRSGPITTLLTILLLGAVITTLQMRRIRKRRAWVAGATALGLIAGYTVVAHVLFSQRGLIVELASPVMSCVLITVASLVAALATEGREKAQLRSVFSQYVNDALVDRLLADPARATLGGERRELTVLFSDIRGFSSFSEKLEPERLSEYLNQYFTPMTELVMNEGGMLDKYIGDAVMAVYGAPVDMRDHAERACRTALAMIAAIKPLNDRWRELGLPEISIGVGLNTGPMSVGNMGSEARFDYTVLGDAVNLGARMEGLTKQYQVHVLVGEDTARAAGDGFVFRELDWVQVKGRAGTARIYELLGARGSTTPATPALDQYAEALTAYREGDWDRAEQGFSNFLADYPGDGPSQVMLARIAELRQAPPQDWDGVFQQRSK